MRLAREIDAQMELGECPLWDHRHRQLYWVDVIKCALYRLDWASGDVATWPLPALGGGLGLLGEADLIVAVQTGLFRFRPATGHYAFLLQPNPGQPTQRLNEGKTDPDGNFWIGAISTLGRFPECSLFRVTPSGEVGAILSGVCPNALVFFDGGATFADSAERLIWKFDRTPDGRLANRRVFVDDTARDSIPDGAALDASGDFWSAKFGGGRVVAYDVQGRAAQEIELPATQVTSCAFCGPDLDHLAVTTAKRLLDAEARRKQPQAGNLFLFKSTARALKEPVCPGIAVNAPKETGRAIDASALSKMKPGALLVNTARGPVVDQSALFAALKSGRIAGAALDVFETEPPDADLLAGVPNLLCAAHLGGISRESVARMTAPAARSVIAVLAGAMPETVVNRGALLAGAR